MYLGGYSRLQSSVFRSGEFFCFFNGYFPSPMSGSNSSSVWLGLGRLQSPQDRIRFGVSRRESDFRHCDCAKGAIRLTAGESEFPQPVSSLNFSFRCLVGLLVSISYSVWPGLCSLQLPLDCGLRVCTKAAIRLMSEETEFPRPVVKFVFLVSLSRRTSCFQQLFNR